MLRIRVSDLDGYVWWKEWGDGAAQLAARICKLEPRTANMRLGIAFEDWLMAGARPGAQVGGYRFGQDDDIDVHTPSWDSEQVSLSRGVQLQCGDGLLVGRLDAVRWHDLVIDWKTSTKSIKPETYIDAWQWRCYLWLADMERFRYEVFQLYARSAPDVRILDHKSFECVRYDAMETHIMQMLEEYSGVVRALEKDGWLMVDDLGRIAHTRKLKEAVGQHVDIG